MINMIAVGSLVLSLAGAPLSVEPTAPPGGKIDINLVNLNGSGCPAGTTAVAISPDNSAFTVTYSAYLAQVGVGAKSTDGRKNCQLAVQVQVPQGFTYAIAKTDNRGYMNLAKGANAIEKTSYYFQGMSQGAAASRQWNGPYDDNWQTTDEVPVAAMVYSPCGEIRYLMVNTELRANGGSSDLTKTTSFISMDSTDTEFSTKFFFSWAKCPAK